MKSILGIGNALTDILVVLKDDELLHRFNIPAGSMQHVDGPTANEIWNEIKNCDVQYVAGGSAANTITCTSIFGMPSGFVGKIGNDEIGELYGSCMRQFGINANLFRDDVPSGRAMVFITAPNAERTFAVHLGAAYNLQAEDICEEYFKGYDYFHIEGYLVQSHPLILKAVQMAKAAGCIISIDMASYNVVESNREFLQDMIKNYVDIVFANESEAKAFTQNDDPVAALREISTLCDIAVVKVGKEGSYARSGQEEYFFPARPAKPIDATGAGDTYAAGFIYAHSLGLPLIACGEVASIIAAKVVEVIGTKIDIPRWKAAKDEIRELVSAYIDIH